MAYRLLVYHTPILGKACEMDKISPCSVVSFAGGRIVPPAKELALLNRFSCDICFYHFTNVHC